MKIHGVMPTKNEASRYLADALANALTVLDDVFVYDDQSDDDTFGVAWDATPHAVKRPDSVPSFLEHEGRFRQACWDEFVESGLPSLGDWVLMIDADEALVATTGEPTREVLEREIAEARDSVGIVLNIPEVYGWADETPLVRTDGLWGQIRGWRLFRYREAGRYLDLPMGCNAEPSYVRAGPLCNAQNLVLMHFGYADKADQAAKYHRYTSLATHGHLDAHVNSIITPQTLVPWQGVSPRMRHRSNSRVG